MSIVITYPFNYFLNNWFISMFNIDDEDMIKNIRKKIQNDELYFTPRAKLTDTELLEAQQDLNEHIGLPALQQDKNDYISDVRFTKTTANRKYFLNCLEFNDLSKSWIKGKAWRGQYGVILNDCEPLKNLIVLESREIEGVKFYYYENGLCPEEKKNQLKEDIETLNNKKKIPTSAIPTPEPEPVKVPATLNKKKIKIAKKKENVIPAAPAPVVEAPTKGALGKKKIKIAKKVEKKPDKNVDVIDTGKLKELEDLYKGKLTKKAKSNVEYITLKYKSIPPKSHFIKDLPLKEGRRYLSTPERPMNAAIKRYIDMIYPEQKYKDKMEEMIDKIRLFGLLMRNIEKEASKNKSEVIPIEEKKIIKEQIKQKKNTTFGQLYKYYKDYVKKRKEGIKETKEDRQKKKEKIEQFREYIRNLREERNLTSNVFTKKELKKQIDDFQDIINYLLNKKTKRMKEEEEEEEDD